MNNYSNPYISKKPKPENYLQNQRVLHSQKQCSQVKFDRSQSQSNGIKNDFRALIEVIPSDQKLIEQYISQLKDKLQQIRNSPKKKNSSRIETEQIFKRNYKQTKSKSKPKSNDGYSRTKSIAQSTNFHSAKKMNQINGLNNFKQARDQFKRSKQRIFQRRATTEKQNNRYSEGKVGKTQAKHTPTVTQSCDLRLRSNTQQVIRSQNNPARIYRYSSLKKTGCVEDPSVNNNFLFDKIINFHHNINIYAPSEPPKAKERLRRQLNQQLPTQQNSRKPSPSPKKKQEQMAEKIQDLSTINAKKQTLNFLGESGLDLKEQLQKRQEKQVSKILDFLGWKTNEMKKVLTNLKQKKRKNGLDKLGKIFPKGFFV